MALTDAEKNVLKARLENLQRQSTMQKVIDEMARLQEFVDKSGFEAFCSGTLVHGGGFFYLGKTLMGVVDFFVGYAISGYGVWLLIRSGLSYFLDFERSWVAAGVWLGIGVIFGLVESIRAACLAPKVRERAMFELSVLREACSDCCASA